MSRDTPFQEDAELARAVQEVNAQASLQRKHSPAVLCIFAKFRVGPGGVLEPITHRSWFENDKDKKTKRQFKTKKDGVVEL